MDWFLCVYRRSYLIWSPSWGHSCWRAFYHNFSKVGFCWVCGFKVRVWESYRTSTYRSFGLGYKTLTNSQKFRVLWSGRTELTEVPSIVTRAYTTHTSSGYLLWNRRTELTEAPIVARAYRTHRNSDRVPGVQNSQKFQLWHGRTGYPGKT